MAAAGVEGAVSVLVSKELEYRYLLSRKGSELGIDAADDMGTEGQPEAPNGVRGT